MTPKKQKEETKKESSNGQLDELMSTLQDKYGEGAL